MVASFIVLLPLLLLIAVLVAGIVMWAAGVRKARGGEMACGNCGYFVRGLQQLKCPECGADLRDVGITGGGSGGGTKTAGMIMAITSACLLFGCVGLSMVGWLFAAKSVQQPTPVPVQQLQQSQPMPIEPLNGQGGTEPGADGESLDPEEELERDSTPPVEGE